MDSTLSDCVDSSLRSLLPSNKDSNIEINESQFNLKEEENGEIEKVNQQAYDELYTFSLQLVKKNRKLKEESKKLNKDLIYSKEELREK